MFLRANDLWWVTKDGTPIPIVCMDLKHLKNTIAMLERTNRTDSPSYPHLVAEARKREQTGG